MFIINVVNSFVLTRSVKMFMTTLKLNDYKFNFLKTVIKFAYVVKPTLICKFNQSVEQKYIYFGIYNTRKFFCFIKINNL